MKYINILFLALILFNTSCEEQMVVIPEVIADDNGRVVLIEEITGVRCPNCPAGAAAIEGLKEQFPGRIVSVGYHSDFLAAPLPESHYDFRYPGANEVETYIGAFIGKPSAAINRVLFENEDRDWLSVIDSWGGHVQDQLNIPPKLKLFIDNEYDAATREVKIKVRGIPFGNSTGNYKITVLITESHIEDAQEDPTTIIEEYEHNHIYHAFITNNIEGDSFAESFELDVEIEKNYTYTLPEEEGIWIPENCDIVAFISEIDGTKKEVLQAAEAAVVE